MASPFSNSLFYQIVFKPQVQTQEVFAVMGGVWGSRFRGPEPLSDLDVVVFDFETTGLDTKTAKIIELGAIKFRNQKEVDRFSTLVHPKQKLPPETFGLTGINDEMLEGKPHLEEVLPSFHDFLKGCLGVAHNAEFDTQVLIHESARFGILCNYHCICTLKMARELLPQLERKNLDTLANHFGFQFESRHRSIGDILVTADVLWRLLDLNPQLATIAHLEPYRQPMT
jgi:DNA polymerase III epsilon subunit family exonuclease